MDKNEGFVTDITDKDELNEIDKVQNMLNPRVEPVTEEGTVKSQTTY